jgi:hypothetical protein
MDKHIKLVLRCFDHCLEHNCITVPEDRLLASSIYQRIQSYLTFDDILHHEELTQIYFIKCILKGAWHRSQDFAFLFDISGLIDIIDNKLESSNDDVFERLWNENIFIKRS